MALLFSSAAQSVASLEFLLALKRRARADACVVAREHHISHYSSGASAATSTDSAQYCSSLLEYWSAAHKQLSFAYCGIHPCLFKKRRSLFFMVGDNITYI